MVKLALELPTAVYSYTNSKSGKTYTRDLTKFSNAILTAALQNGFDQKLGDSVAGVKKDDKETWGDFDNLSDAAHAVLTEVLESLDAGVWSRGGGGGPRIPAIDSYRREVLIKLAVDTGYKVGEASKLFIKRAVADDWQVAALVQSRFLAALPNEKRKAETIHRALLDNRPDVDEFVETFVNPEAQRKLDEYKASLARTTITADAMTAMLQKMAAKKQAA